MGFPPPIDCPGCGSKAHTHIYFKAFFCYKCNTSVPLTNKELDACFREIPANGKKSLVPPEREREGAPEPGGIIPPLPIRRPFPGELPRAEWTVNPKYAGVYFPGDMTHPKRIEAIPMTAADDEPIFEETPEESASSPPLPSRPLQASPPPKEKVKPPDDDGVSDFIRRLREKCGRPV